jgi:hypothetical protein
MAKRKKKKEKHGTYEAEIIDNRNPRMIAVHLTQRTPGPDWSQ